MSLVAKLPIAAVGMILLTGAGTESRPAEVLGNLTCNFGEAVETETKANRAQKILCVFDFSRRGPRSFTRGRHTSPTALPVSLPAAPHPGSSRAPQTRRTTRAGSRRATQCGAARRAISPSRRSSAKTRTRLRCIPSRRRANKRETPREPPREPPPSISSSRQPPLRRFVRPGARRARRAMRAPSAGPRSRRPSCRNSRSRPLVQSRPFAPRP